MLWGGKESCLVHKGGEGECRDEQTEVSGQSVRQVADVLAAEWVVEGVRQVVVLADT